MHISQDTLERAVNVISLRNDIDCLDLCVATVEVKN